ncbi:MAG: bifunctional 4-hydroxy-2-oxoglutarate aldolase/2-dehydro-3-deoxy-phosphogluconate aldolase [Anaerolineaceae bacterium]|nr:MAG: bifunctional 4-hydroxy-2-oxoglutarate aldolase/2-dehydro-3-deoxy-phosphogluconate aldolase [Anaerolineaceae bacterium]
MGKNDTLSRISNLGLLAVVRGPSLELTLQMVEALILGGVYGIEITFTTPNASEVVKILDETYGAQALLGMGTLTTIEHVEQAVEAGARFVVSPHCDEGLAQAMIDTGLATMVGAFTPSEILKAHRMGSDVVKLYPGSLGTPKYLKSLRGPFPDIPIMPTGGVDIENIGEWFAAGAFAVGAGSALCPSAWALEGRFEEMTKRAKAFVQEVERAR